MYTVADSLATLKAEIPTGLVTPGSLAAITQLSRRLPAALCECFGFEVRLGDDQARTDFALQVCTPRGWRLLARASELAPFSEIGDAPATSWKRISTLAAARCAGQRGYESIIANAWLEFDVEPSSPRHGVPAVFLELTAEGGTARRLSSVFDALEQLAGARMSPEGRRTIAECADNLPAAARISQVGTMLSRDRVPVRLCVCGLTPDGLVDYVRVVGSAALGELAHGLFEAVPPQDAQLTLDLDVIDRVLPRIGIEYALRENRQLDGRPEPRWAQFLSRLRDIELCTPAKCDAVLAWAGADRRRFRHRPQPTLAFRGLSHVKIESAGDGQLVAKAYVGFLPDRLTLLFAADETDPVPRADTPPHEDALSVEEAR